MRYIPYKETEDFLENIYSRDYKKNHYVFYGTLGLLSGVVLTIIIGIIVV